MLKIKIKMLKLDTTFGKWAIVTGASSGIGKEFAYQLAQQGLNLILLARSTDKLQNISNTLSQEHGIEVKIMSVDLSQPLPLDNLNQLTYGLDVGLLISNAGNGRMGAFNQFPIESLESMVQLNVAAHLQLSHWFTTKRLQQNKKGGLLLVSSTTALQGTPYTANYSASKAYVLNFGEALNYELKDKGIHVSVLVPGPTNTPGLTENKDADMVSNLPMKPQEVNDLVKEGLDGLVKNKPMKIGGASNRIMYKMMKLTMSRKSATSFWGKMMKKMVSII